MGKLPSELLTIPKQFFSLPEFADIVFATAVRQAFTYSVPDDLDAPIQPGMRVWVPFQRRKTIGMVARLHDETPPFNTRPVERVLDSRPILSGELLKLTHWMHRFYYCGWGEVIQAALPAGLNFYAEQYIRAADAAEPGHLGAKEREIVREIRDHERYQLKEAQQRWSAGTIKTLIGQKIIEVWEEPEMKVAPKTDKLWDWQQGVDEAQVRTLIEEHRNSNKMYKWVRALEVLLDYDLPCFNRELNTHELLEAYTLNRIADEGLIHAREVEANDLSYTYAHEPEKLKTLNHEQEAAYQRILEAIEADTFQNFLLYGVTGSGKTEVYIHALKQVLAKGQGGLVLVPEIGLTPQIVRRFYQIFGDDIAVLHSRLTQRERYDAWQALQEGDKRIAIGARSAVFAPVKNLGLIVIDEEHDGSYKQEDPAPRYHARDVAIMRGTLNQAAVVMGSATPSMVSLHGVRRDKSIFLRLNERPFHSSMPTVKVLDLKQYQPAMRGPLAIPLFNNIRQALERGEQTILLQNRRGYASFVQCTACGHLPECPNCSVSLTYHKHKRQLRCHYCGYSQHQSQACRECGQKSLQTKGSGTQQLEDDIAELFPEAAVLRMDFDTTSGKDAHANILSAFGRGEADILVGTQIVGKGLDFPNVTVVGVINADTELAFPSFRAGERMYQLLSQVAGRSGRADKEGYVYFQTWQPDHPALQAAKDHDFKAFAQRELAYRKSLNYPPYSRIIRFTFKGKKERRVQQVAQVFTGCMADIAGSLDPVLGPSPAAIARMQRYYRWETMLKINPANGAGVIEQLLDRTFARFDEKKPEGASSVRINVNVDALE